MRSSKPFLSLGTLLLFSSSMVAGNAPAEAAVAFDPVAPLGADPLPYSAPALDQETRQARVGNLLAVLSAQRGLLLMDVTQPGAAVPRLQVPLQGVPVWVGVLDNRVLALMDQTATPRLPGSSMPVQEIVEPAAGQLVVVDVANPASPVLVQRLEMPAGLAWAGVVHNTVCAVTAQAVLSIVPDALGQFSVSQQALWPNQVTRVAFAETAVVGVGDTSTASWVMAFYPAVDGSFTPGGQLQLAGALAPGDTFRAQDSGVDVVSVGTDGATFIVQDVALGGASPVLRSSWSTSWNARPSMMALGAGGLWMARSTPGRLAVAAAPQAPANVSTAVELAGHGMVLGLARVDLTSDVVALIRDGLENTLLHFARSSAAGGQPVGSTLLNQEAFSPDQVPPRVRALADVPRVAVLWEPWTPTLVRVQDPRSSSVEVVDLLADGDVLRSGASLGSPAWDALHLDVDHVAVLGPAALDIVPLLGRTAPAPWMLRSNVVAVDAMGSHLVRLVGLVGGITYGVEVLASLDPDSAVVSRAEVDLEFPQLFIHGSQVLVLGASQGTGGPDARVPGLPWHARLEVFEAPGPATQLSHVDSLFLPGPAFHMDSVAVLAPRSQRAFLAGDALVVLQDSMSFASSTNTGCGCGTPTGGQVLSLNAVVFSLPGLGMTSTSVDSLMDMLGVVAVDGPALVGGVSGFRSSVPDARIRRINLANPASPSVEDAATNMPGTLLATAPQAQAFFSSVTDTSGSSSIQRTVGNDPDSRTSRSLQGALVAAEASSAELVWVLHLQGTPVDEDGLVQPWLLTAVDFTHDTPAVSQVALPEHTRSIQRVDGTRVAVRTDAAVFIFRKQGQMVQLEASIPSEDVSGPLVHVEDAVLVPTGAGGVWRQVLVP